MEAANSLPQSSSHSPCFFFEQVGPTLKKVGEVAFDFFKQTAKQVHYLLTSIEARRAIHNTVLGVFQIVKGVTNAGPLHAVASTISAAEMVFDALDIFQVGKYFCKKEQEGVTKEPQYARENGNIVTKDKNYDTTQCLHDAKVGKVPRIIANVGASVSAIASIFTLLDTFKVLPLAQIGAHLGQVPVVGGVLSAVVSSTFFSGLAVGGAALYYGAMTVDAVMYLAKAYQGEGDLTKGWLQLASRVASLAFFLTVGGLMIAGVSLPWVTGSIGAVAGILGLVSCIYSNVRKEKKEAEQVQLQAEVQGGAR